MTQLIINEAVEKKSRFGIPHENARLWYWKDNLQNKGYLRAISEMEALDRLDEAIQNRGRLTWISEKDYKNLKQ